MTFNVPAYIDNLRRRFASELAINIHVQCRRESMFLDVNGNVLDVWKIRTHKRHIVVRYKGPATMMTKDIVIDPGLSVWKFGYDDEREIYRSAAETLLREFADLETIGLQS